MSDDTMTDPTLTVLEVCGKLASAGVDEAEVGRVFAARLEPKNLKDRSRKFCLAARAPGDTVYLIVYKFGKAIGDEIDHWTPVYLAVEGPFDLPAGPAGNPTPEGIAAIEAKSKELTA